MLNPTWTAVELNTDLRREQLAVNCLSYSFAT